MFCTPASYPGCTPVYYRTKSFFLRAMPVHTISKRSTALQSNKLRIKTQALSHGSNLQQSVRAEDMTPAISVPLCWFRPFVKFFARWSDEEVLVSVKREVEFLLLDISLPKTLGVILIFEFWQILIGRKLKPTAILPRTNRYDNTFRWVYQEDKVDCATVRFRPIEYFSAI